MLIANTIQIMTSVGTGFSVDYENLYLKLCICRQESLLWLWYRFCRRSYFVAMAFDLISSQQTCLYFIALDLLYISFQCYLQNLIKWCFQEFVAGMSIACIQSQLSHIHHSYRPLECNLAYCFWTAINNDVQILKVWSDNVVCMHSDGWRTQQVTMCCWLDNIHIKLQTSSFHSI